MGIGVGRRKEIFSSLLAASHSGPKSKAAADICGRLHLTLMRCVARRAILARGLRPM